MRRKTIWLIAFAVLACALFLIAAVQLLKIPVIGRVYGAENEFLEINGVVYVHTTDRPYTSNDRGKYLGAVKNENITMRVYEVEGDESGQWRFALWEWEGYFYRRIDEET